MIHRICDVCGKELKTDKPRLKYHYPDCKKVKIKEQYRAWRQKVKKEKYEQIKLAAATA